MHGPGLDAGLAKLELTHFGYNGSWGFKSIGLEDLLTQKDEWLYMYMGYICIEGKCGTLYT